MAGLRLALAVCPLMMSACDTNLTTSTRNEVGFYSGLPSADRNKPAVALQNALEKRLSGQQTVWRSASGASGSVVPVETWKSTSDHWCRNFRETIKYPGKRARKRTGTACRVNKSWKVLEG